MAAPPPAKRQRKLVVLSSSDNEDSGQTFADISSPQGKNKSALTYSRSSANASSRENSSSRAKTATTATGIATNGTGRTRASTRQQKKPATVSPKKGKKSQIPQRQDEASSRSIHNFFQPATDEQRWSFHKSELGSQLQPQQEASFTDVIEDDIIDDDYDILDEGIFDRITAPKEKEKEKEQPVTAKKVRTAVKRFILDNDLGTHTNSKIRRTELARAEESDSKKPWSEQYPPTSLEELAVHKKKVSDVQSWMASALSGRSKHKLLVLHGPAGSGKTSTISLLSDVLNFEVVEWRSPFGTDTGNGQYSSLSTQFDNFLGQLSGFGGLDLGDLSISQSTAATQTSQTPRRRVILIEEFPTSLSRGSTTLSSFQASLRRYIASNSPNPLNLFGNNRNMGDATPPIVLIISETMLGMTGSISENLTAHRLLGPELYTSPATAIIEFNSIAPTFMLKALQLVLKKEARQSMRQRIPGTGVLKRFSEIGDIRSAISSLEFLCLRDDKSDDWGGRVASKSKSSSNALTAMEKESLELITQRESSLGLFHAVGKVVYNKRDDVTDSTEQAHEVHVAPPSHLQHLDRPKVSQVSVEDMMDKTGTDVHTFTAALHENYPPSCDGPTFLESLEACIDNLSDSDILGSETRSFLSNSRNGVGTARTRFLGYGASLDRLRQDEISFHVAVRGMLFSLPYPVRRKVDQSSSSSRRVGGAFKMYFPTSQRLWKEIEEVEGLVNMWERQLLLDPSGLLRTAGQKSGQGSDAGVASWKTNALNAELSFKQKNDDSQPVLTPSVMSREDVLLHYLPYLSKVMSNKNGAASVQGLDRVTQFKGITAPKEEDIPDDLPEDADAATDWSTDPVHSHPIQKTGLAEMRSSKEEVVKDTEEHLFLSDDDIVD